MRIREGARSLAEDFNSVQRNASELKGRIVDRPDVKAFTNFIVGNELIDLPLAKR
ncbi:hypothetical protein SLEP1_g10900 [Rubroshorea leprosula]|uniref:Uncharacterized protein n=1 Tax=Rubroshorea leprosula TaxID=152421 RepID=A0AAV5IFB6_9ROSI|nr:hypothetical protein SLEP1_g10900 [Rubroshorea leprosula]